MDPFQPQISDVRDKISMHIQRTGISTAWLAQQTNSSRSHVSRILKKERPLYQPLLDKINDALETNFIIETKKEQDGPNA